MSILDHWILEGKTPVKVDTMTWARWLGDEVDKRRVQYHEKDGISVSTVFLGLNHQFGNGPPLLFETMIFGGEQDQWQDRCSTWEEAEEQHKIACAIAGIGNPDEW